MMSVADGSYLYIITYFTYSTWVVVYIRYIMVQVVLTRVGYQMPVSYFSAEQLREMAQSVLQALSALHSKGLLHCDVREENILYDPRPFLNDLEMAHKCPWVRSRCPSDHCCSCGSVSSLFRAN